MNDIETDDYFLLEPEHTDLLSIVLVVVALLPVVALIGFEVAVYLNR